jgi:hypothetical protein
LYLCCMALPYIAVESHSESTSERENPRASTLGFSSVVRQR